MSTRLNVILSSIFSFLFVNNVDQVIPRLWLGDYTMSSNLQFIEDNSIDIIVNCTPGLPFVKSSILTPTCIRIPVYDSLTTNDYRLMQRYLETLIPYLVSQYKAGKKILVHCYAGKQRSAIVVASLLFTLVCNHDITLPNLTDISNKTPRVISVDIFKFIVQKRHQAFTYGFRINFLESFNNYFNLS